jgi:hypothetical protein
MYTEELLVHDGSKGQAAERLHTRVVNPLRIFVLTWLRY